MQHTLRICFILLALATTGLFAEAATEPVVTPAPAHHQSHPVHKIAKKTHKKHRKHKKKAR